MGNCVRREIGFEVEDDIDAPIIRRKDDFRDNYRGPIIEEHEEPPIREEIEEIDTRPQKIIEDKPKKARAANKPKPVEPEEPEIPKAKPTNPLRESRRGRRRIYMNHFENDEGRDSIGIRESTNKYDDELNLFN